MHSLQLSRFRRNPADRSSAEEVADDVGGFSVARFEEVGVDVERGGGVGVAETAADRANRDAGLEELGGVEVPEIVEPHPVEAGPLADPREPGGGAGKGVVGPGLKPSWWPRGS